VTVSPFAKPDRALRAGVEAEAQRLAGFLGGESDVAWA
jgi:hypothetical protein